MSPTAKHETNSAGFQSFAVRADSGPGTAGRHRKLNADVADLASIEAPPAAMPPDDQERAELEAALLECGFSPTQALVDRLDILTSRLAFTRCAEALRHLVRALGDTPAGRGLERALLGSDGQSLEKDAKQVGCTRQNLHHHEKTARLRLRHLTPGTPLT